MLRTLRPASTTARRFTTSCVVHGKILESYSKAPQPTAEVPDVETFLKKIGRNSEQHAKHFESWEQLMTMSSDKFKAAGIETRDRRYILQWRERFRQSISLEEHKRGKKQWGGERRAKENKAIFYGRKRAEEKSKA